MAPLAIADGFQPVVEMPMYCERARCIVVAAFMCSGAFANEFEGADWIRDPRFEQAPVLNLFHREKDPVPELFGPVNVHTLFRKDILLRERPIAASLAITGDDYFKFHINGQYAAQGPAPAYHFVHPFLLLEVKEYLKAGINCLSSHVYYQGLRNRVWNSGDNRSGFIMSLDVRYADGTTDRFVTDATWRCFQLEAFPDSETIGYQTQFLEHIDMRLMPRDWRMPNFDDSQWLEPLVGGQDHNFVRQITPPLQLERRAPSVVKRLGGGRFFYDFGQVLVGCTRIRLKGEAGRVVTVRHGEELLENGEVRYDMRASCRYEEYPVLSGEEELIEFYDYRSFRYLELLDAPGEPEVWVEVRHHPYDESKVDFQCDNALLADTWRICAQGVKMGSQEVFVDCPSREKGQYLGDAVITARSHLWLTGDPTLTRKAVMDFAHSRHIHPGIMAVAPGSFMQEIAEYSLQYPLFVLNFFKMTGDRVVAQYAVDAVFEDLFAYFAAYENEAGLLVGIDKENSKWVLVDWPKNLRDDYDYDYSLIHGNTVLNAFYYGALRAAAELQRLLGKNSVRYDTRADRLALAFAEHLVNPDTGLYRDAPGSAHSSLHANAVPLAFGLSEGADRERMLAHIAEKRLACGVYIASYVIEGLFKAGAGDLAFSLLTSTDEHSWHEMLRHGATTCMEAWGPDQKWNTSWLHPWSSSPIYLIAEYVFGLSPAEPGWERIRIAPVAIADLPAMSLTAPLPQGAIQASYSPKEGFLFKTPANVPIELAAPANLPVRVVSQPVVEDVPEGAPDAAALEKAGWKERVGDGVGLWASAPAQRLFLIQSGRILWQALCSTAAKGVGARQNSEQTPPGWHRVAQKIGDKEPWGRVFRSRAAVNEVWQEGEEAAEDMVLSRVFVLEGLEPGVNQGQDAQGRVVDSMERFIYIHGTNDEKRLGTPSSHGCIRLSNDDVIALFEMIPEGTLLYIAS